MKVEMTVLRRGLMPSMPTRAKMAVLPKLGAAASARITASIELFTGFRSYR